MLRPLTIGLTKGLDLTSPAMAKEPGTLIGCLNYEFTSIGGASRIDGYERYDGWANGSLSDIWEVPITIVDAPALAAATAGDIIKLTTAQGTVHAGIFIELTTSFLGNDAIRYLPLTKEVSVIRTSDVLIVDGGSGTDATASGSSYPMYERMGAITYATEVRDAATALRSQVVDSPTPVCGVHWFRNNLLEVRDAPKYTLNGVSNSFTNVGDVLQIGTLVGLVIAKTTSPLTVWLEPLVSGTTSTSLSVLNKDGTASGTATASSVSTDTGESEWAYMVALDTPETATDRGAKRMHRSVIVEFDNGAQVGGLDPQVGGVVNIGPNATTDKLLLFIKNIILTGGSWAAGTAAGRMELIPANQNSASVTSGAGPYNKIAVGDSVRSGSSGTGVFFVIDTVHYTYLAGTKKLRIGETHYVGFNANFLGADDDQEAYLTNGAGRAVWAKYFYPTLTGYEAPPSATALGDEEFFSYGNIRAETIDALDKPKFCSRHGRLCLALGYKGGTVSISVANEPHNFNGVDGAQSLPMGDEITGLLETVGDTTLVFGRRSIARLAGIADQITAGTVSPDSGALPYSCVNVGRIPVFADQNGVSTITQSETYSDFIGSRVSDKVQLKLRPSLVTSIYDTNIGGVNCAIPVRSKNQYRLFLRSGEVYSFCMNDPSNPQIGISDYSPNDGMVRTPLAWSSQLADNGKERIHVVWDPYYAKYAPSLQTGSYNPISQLRVYELDAGWGFDGETFDSYIETAHLYNDNSQNFIGIHNIRLFGVSHGVCSLQVRAKGIETNFDQAYTDAAQDISLPYNTPSGWYRSMQEVTNFVDLPNWGLGISLRFESSQDAGLTTTEPPHVLQVAVLHIQLEGASDG